MQTVREDVRGPVSRAFAGGGSELVTQRIDQRLLISVEEAAQRLNLGRDRTYELIRSGQLEHIRIGRLIKVTVAGLQKWVDTMVNGQLDVDQLR